MHIHIFTYLHIDMHSQINIRKVISTYIIRFIYEYMNILTYKFRIHTYIQIYEYLNISSYIIHKCFQINEYLIPGVFKLVSLPSSRCGDSCSDADP